jgi:hypothetical protein
MDDPKIMQKFENGPKMARYGNSAKKKSARCYQRTLILKGWWAGLDSNQRTQ